MRGDAAVADITVSCDGTWQRRGFSSKNGIATVAGSISKVIDTETLSNYCHSCVLKKNPSDEWLQRHSSSCERNHTGSAGAMEPAGMMAIFNRSLQSRSLRYTRYLGDGDSKSYKTVADAQPYGSVEIEKLECCGHIQKRMGRRLMGKVRQLNSTVFDNDGKSVKGIGGAGKLTQKAILRIQGHYGGAIRKNAGDVRAMKKAVWAIWKHRSWDHTDCSDWDWCPSVTGVGNADRNRLPDFVCEAIKPIFTDLASDSLLSKCAHGGTQNTNESFHNLVWERCPKTTFVGRRRLELAVYDATIVYNEGETPRMAVFRKLGFQPGHYTSAGLAAIDQQRVNFAYVPGTATILAQRQRRSVQATSQRNDPAYTPGGH